MSATPGSQARAVVVLVGSKRQLLLITAARWAARPDTLQAAQAAPQAAPSTARQDSPELVCSPVLAAEVARRMALRQRPVTVAQEASRVAVAAVAVLASIV